MLAIMNVTILEELQRGGKNVSDHERDHIERGTNEVKTAVVSEASKPDVERIQMEVPRMIAFQ